MSEATQTVETLTTQALGMGLIKNKTEGKTLKKAGLLDLIAKYQAEQLKEHTVPEVGPLDIESTEDDNSYIEQQDAVPVSNPPTGAHLGWADNYLSSISGQPLNTVVHIDQARPLGVGGSVMVARKVQEPYVGSKGRQLPCGPYRGYQRAS